MSRRVTPNRLVELAESLDERDREVVRLVANLHLASHRQLSSFLEAADAGGESHERAVRRLLARLTDDGILARLKRRVGGMRAGSNGFVYYLGPVGQRLVAYWDGNGEVRGRRRPEPGERYVAHRLGVTQLYVDLVRASRAKTPELLDFSAEPDCWRSYVDAFGGRTIVKPDAAVTTSMGDYIDSWFVEVDLGTESLSVIAAKARTYWEFFAAGAEQQRAGVFPQVLFLTNSEVRRKRIVEACARLPDEAWSLFVVSTLDQALEVFSGRRLPRLRDC